MRPFGKLSLILMLLAIAVPIAMLMTWGF